jgi:hypothetical protein
VDRTDRLVGVLAHPDALRLFLRSDAAIEMDIEELVVDTHPEADEVTVQVSAGIVTLNGALRLRSTVEHAGWTACCVRRQHRRRAYPFHPVEPSLDGECRSRRLGWTPEAARSLR